MPLVAVARKSGDSGLLGDRTLPLFSASACSLLSPSDCTDAKSGDRMQITDHKGYRRSWP